MESIRIDDTWNYSVNEIKKFHFSFDSYNWYVKEMGIQPEEFLLSDDEPTDIECYCCLCRICGWWLLQKNMLMSAKRSQVWQITLASFGVLKNLDLTNIKIHTNEVRLFLNAKYQSRFSLHPRLFEETVASVFSDLGYEVQLTAYSNDGGIDIFMNDNNNQLIGVQVKRFKNNIAVEQIRSFLGALAFNNCVKGIYVTTSDYTKGACKTAKACKKGFIPIELINSESFLDLLKTAQIKQKHQWENYQFDIINNSVLHPLYSIHMNSL